MRFLAVLLAFSTFAALPGIFGEKTLESQHQDGVKNIAADRKLNGVFLGGEYYPDLDSSSLDADDWDSSDEEEEEDFDEMAGLRRKKYGKRRRKKGGRKKRGPKVYKGTYAGKKRGKRGKMHKGTRPWDRRHDEDDYDWDSFDSMEDWDSDEDEDDWDSLDSIEDWDGLDDMMDDWDSSENEDDWDSSDEEDFDDMTGLRRKKYGKRRYKKYGKRRYKKYGKKKRHVYHVPRDGPRHADE